MEIMVRPIHTEADYDAALELANELMGAEAGSPDGARLDALVASIEAYEARHWPVAPHAPAGSSGTR
jgi:HTH-type transcriptional regulator/antitoxin HigA